MKEIAITAYQCKKCGKLHYPYHDRWLCCKGREVEPVKPREYQLAINEMFQAHVVMRALAKDPRDRHQTPAELLRELDRIGTYNSLDAD